MSAAMTAAGVFSVVNVLPLPIWAMWILAPRSHLSRWLAQSFWPWIVLASIYAAGVAFTFATEPFDPGAFGSLAGIMHLFQSPVVALVGWVHYLCFDLFVGRWIMNDAPEGGHRLAPVLFFTLMLGPVGLLLYLCGRGFFRGLEGRASRGQGAAEAAPSKRT